MVNSRARTHGEGVEKGRALERAVRMRMGAKDIRGIKELVRTSGVGADTLYAWFRGERTPQPGTLLRVAKPLGATIAELWPYDAEEPPPVGVEALVEVVSELVSELRQDRADRVEWERSLLEAARELREARTGVEQ